MEASLPYALKQHVDMKTVFIGLNQPAGGHLTSTS